MNNLSIYRLQTGLTQAQFAKELNWWQSRIGNYEAGTRRPSLFAARKIVNTLNKLGVACSLDDVFPAED